MKKMNKNENAYMILCICEKFKQVYFFIILLLGMRAGGHFTALFLIKTVRCGCLFCMHKEEYERG